MSKNFDDFMKECSKKDWSAVANHAVKSDRTDLNEIFFIANIEVMTTILREYHNWLEQNFELHPKE